MAQITDTNKCIPFGENMRSFVSQSFLSASDLISILKARGVYPLSKEKSSLIPFFQNIILSPAEFDELITKVKTREDNPKTITRVIDMVAEANNLLCKDSISEDIISYVQKNLLNCQLKNGPVKFYPVGGDNKHLIAQFGIVRHEFNKSWSERTNQFEGKVELKLDSNNKCHITVHYTSEEIKRIGDKIVKSQIQSYKNNGMILYDTQVQKILYGDFSNSQRFQFLYSLTSKLSSGYFECEDIKDILICPDNNSPLEEDIKWMEKLKKIVLNGERVDKVFFMNDAKYHEELHFWKVSALYKFNYRSTEGTCVLDMEFSEFEKKKNEAEFVLSISSIVPEKTLSAREKNSLKIELLKLFNEKKTEIFVDLKKSL